MNLFDLTRPFPWELYSKKLQTRCTQFFSAGAFTQEEADVRNLFFATGAAGQKETGDFIQFFLLLDKNDKTIVDARFKACSISATIGLAEAACSLIVGKKYSSPLTQEALDAYLRDRSDLPAFPAEVQPYLALLFQALTSAKIQCASLPWPQKPSTQAFAVLPPAEQMHLVESVLDEEIRPYISLEGGGVTIVSISGTAVTISYSGTCATCLSSGSTLSFIQSTLRTHLDPAITVSAG